MMVVVRATLAAVSVLCLLGQCFAQASALPHRGSLSHSQTVVRKQNGQRKPLTIFMCHMCLVLPAGIHALQSNHRQLVEQVSTLPATGSSGAATSFVLPTDFITAKPSPALSTRAASSHSERHVCVDVADWSDILGERCADYEAQGWCGTTENNELAPTDGVHAGISASVACCACGGGEWVESTTSAPVAAPQTTLVAAFVETTLSAPDVATTLADDAGATLADERTVTMQPLPNVTVEACDTYPCGPDPVEVFSWSSPVSVVAFVEANVDQFHFTLLAANGSVVWHHAGSSRFASFTPSDIRVMPSEEYQLHASVDLADGRSAEAFSATSVSFASSPSLHGAAAEWISGTAAANWFQIVVDATDATRLHYEYFVADTHGGWKYLAADGPNATVIIAVPSTRNFTLGITINNEFGSSVSCENCLTLAARSSSNSSSTEIATDALQLVRSNAATTGLLLAAIDAVGTDPSTTETLLEVLSEAMYTNDTVLSQDIAVVNAAVKAGAVDELAHVLEVIGDRITSANAADSSLSLYLDTLDAYSSALATQANALDGVAQMDAYLSAVCSASQAGSVPDGEVSEFAQQDSVALSCASSEGIVAVEAGAASVLASVDGVSTVAVSTWNGTMNATNTTTFLSAIHGVHIEGGRQAGDAIDVEAAMTLKLSLASSTDAVGSAIREALSCVYYDEPTGTWSDRGVVLRGLEFGDDASLRVMCSSSHLTLFTVGDSSATAKIVNSKIASFADRIDSMNNVNLLDDGTAINWSVMGVFIGSSVLFVVVIAIAKIKGRKAAVNRGRLTFQQDGQLAKPSVMGSRQYEAVLRRWVSGSDTAKFVVFDLLTSNAVLGLLFHWEHEAVVFGRADKSVILFGAVLMTFVSSAFLFDPDESVDDDSLLALWLVTAVLTNVLLLPVQHFLPYMVSNVNSLSTLTRTPTTLLKREMRRVSCWKASRRRKHNNNKIGRATSLMTWVAPASKNGGPGDEWHAYDDDIVHVSTKLHFLHCAVNLPSTSVVGQRHTQLDPKRTRAAHSGVMRFQRLFRSKMRLKRVVRDLEFHAWYNDLRRHRHVLAMLSSSVLLVLAAFTLTICLFLSCAFDDEQSLMWVGDVAQSLVVQVFVTDPTITLMVIFTKLLVSWTLLRIGKKRVKKKLKEQENELETQILTVSTRVEIAAAKARALSAIAGGVAAVVERERAAKTVAKQKCLAALEGIAVAKTHITQMRQTTVRPKKIEVETWDTRESELNVKEQRTRGSLHAIDAALDILGGGHQNARKELHQAQRMIAKLKLKLAKIAKDKLSLRHERAMVDDSRVSNTPSRTVLPIRAVASADHELEPAAARSAMPMLRQAVRLCEEISLIDSKPKEAPVVVRSPTKVDMPESRDRQHSRRRRRRQWRRRKAARATGGDSSFQRRFGHAMGTKRETTRRRSRSMTWGEIRTLQRALKAKAAKEAARKQKASRPFQRARRGRKNVETLSPKAVQVILKRRERRRQLLERRASDASITLDGEEFNI